MKLSTMTSFLFRQTALSVMLFFVAQVNAAPTVQIKDNWIPEAPPNAKTLAAYFTITNTGKSDLTLMGAHCDAFAKAEIHKTMKKGNMSSMMEQKNVVVAAGKSLKFAPGGYHLMLINPKSAIKAEQTHNITFQFADQSELTMPFPVVKRKMNQQHDHTHQPMDENMDNNMSDDSSDHHHHDM